MCGFENKKKCLENTRSDSIQCINNAIYHSKIFHEHFQWFIFIEFRVFGLILKPIHFWQLNGDWMPYLVINMEINAHGDFHYFHRCSFGDNNFMYPNIYFLASIQLRERLKCPRCTFWPCQRFPISNQLLARCISVWAKSSLPILIDENSPFPAHQHVHDLSNDILWLVQRLDDGFDSELKHLNWIDCKKEFGRFDMKIANNSKVMAQHLSTAAIDMIRSNYKCSLTRISYISLLIHHESIFDPFSMQIKRFRSRLYNS